MLISLFSAPTVPNLKALNWTRRSENDNTPQPLDQWTNSPFIGQQVGNCMSFTLTYYLADPFAMHHGPRSIPLCIQHHIQLTSLSFQVSRPSHSWVTATSIFYLQNPRSRSWVRSKLKSRCESNILSTRIPFVPCQSAIPFLRYDFFKIWPWKSKVKVMEEVNIESRNMGPTFHRLTALPFLRYVFFKIWPWKSKVNVKWPWCCTTT